MKLDFIPFSPIAFPPDLEWLLVHPQYYMLAGGSRSKVLDDLLRQQVMNLNSALAK